jgi:hypothetical protein
VYGRKIEGKELTFGVSGKLHANNLVMYDHQTDSLWSHLVGAAITGPLKGKKLKLLESLFTRWETWRRLYPGTKVLTTGSAQFFGSLRDPYESYYRSADTGILPTRRSDKRIYPKEFVLGLAIHGKARAYPFSVLSRLLVVNDVFEAIPLLVTFEKESATVMAFTRRVKGQILSFKRVQLTEQRGFFLVDDVTGSVWNGLTGRAIRGRLKGQKLEHLPMASAFWFGWVDHYPKTEIFQVKK